MSINYVIITLGIRASLCPRAGNPNRGEFTSTETISPNDASSRRITGT